MTTDKPKTQKKLTKKQQLTNENKRKLEKTPTWDSNGEVNKKIKTYEDSTNKLNRPVEAEKEKVSI